MEEACNELSDCSGFSFSSGKSGNKKGTGCLKSCGNDDSTNGYGYGSHDYYEKSYLKKYTKKWPNCDQNRCSIGWSTLDKYVDACNEWSDCSGFSFSTGKSGADKGWGCLKYCGEIESSKGYGSGSHDFYEKPGSSLPSNAEYITNGGEAFILIPPSSGGQRIIEAKCSFTQCQNNQYLSSGLCLEYPNGSVSHPGSTSIEQCYIDCEDNTMYQGRCPGWASRGECTNKPGFMLRECKFSCRNCSSVTS